MQKFFIQQSKNDRLNVQEINFEIIIIDYIEYIINEYMIYLNNIITLIIYDIFK